MLSSATTDDAILKKAIVQKRRYEPQDSRRSEHRSRGWSRSRSRSPDRKRQNRYTGSSYSKKSNYGSGYKKKRKSSGGGGGSSNKKSKSDTKSKGIIETFTDFWSSVSNTALTMVTSTGLCLENIPALDAMPIGGRVRQCVPNWRIICSNSWVLNVVEQGYCIPLETIPRQESIPSNPAACGEAHDILVNEALTLKEKSAISVVEHSKDEYISSYFAVPKPNRPGQFRPILNLKYFNNNVKKYKFSMESVKSIREWIQPNYFCIGLDLADAFLHIPFHDSSKKYLRFKWLRQLLEWQVIVFGLTCSPRVLTKVIKPIIAFLRLTFAILVSIYLDDMLLQSHSPELCTLHMEILCLVFMSLGWSFKWSKCSLKPSQQFHHLGFDWDTKSMTISCPKSKVNRLQTLCSEAFSSASVTVLKLEKILGTMESVKPAVPLTNLHLRSLQRQLIDSKRPNRNPNGIIILSQKSMDDLSWWISPRGFAANCSAPIRYWSWLVLGVYEFKLRRPPTTQNFLFLSENLQILLWKYGAMPTNLWVDPIVQEELSSRDHGVSWSCQGTLISIGWSYVQPEKACLLPTEETLFVSI